MNIKNECNYHIKEEFFYIDSQRPLRENKNEGRIDDRK